MKTKLMIAAVFLLLFSTGKTFASSETIPDVIKKMRSSASEIKSMRCIFSKKIVKEGVEIPETIMEFKYLRSPETLFVEFLNRYKGQKCLYIRGHNDGKMIVKPSGLMSFMKLDIDPAGQHAMAVSLDPMTNMDFNSAITILENLLKKGSSSPGSRAEIVNDVMDNNQSCHLIRFFSVTDKNDFFHMYIDKHTYLPHKIKYREGNNIATYLYSDVALNAGLTEKDVTID